jgi:cytochrome c-type biogenesis protein CcmH/NrfG
MAPEQAAGHVHVDARADESLSKAIELNGADAEARRRRGCYRLEAGRAADALADFEAVLKLSPALESTLRPYIDRAQAELDF